MYVFISGFLSLPIAWYHLFYLGDRFHAEAEGWVADVGKSAAVAGLNILVFGLCLLVPMTLWRIHVVASGAVLVAFMLMAGFVWWPSVARVLEAVLLSARK